MSAALWNPMGLRSKAIPSRRSATRSTCSVAAKSRTPAKSGAPRRPSWRNTFERSNLASMLSIGRRWFPISLSAALGKTGTSSSASAHTSFQSRVSISSTRTCLMTWHAREQGRKSILLAQFGFGAFRKFGRLQEVHSMGASRFCSVDGCEKGIVARSFCELHYRRFKRAGDPLKGKNTHAELMAFYENVVLKHVGDECLIWPFGRYSNGYAQMTLKGKPGVVSRFVCIEENGAPPTQEHEAAHSCGKGHLGCVSRRHLRWATSAENKADRVEHGTSNRGMRNGGCRLTQDQVSLIFRLEGVRSSSQLAIEFGVSRTTIRKIHRGEKWGWLTGVKGPRHV